jgi:hypothetical protein
MIGMGMGGAIRHHIVIKGIQMDLAAVEAFMQDLYANAGLTLTPGFDPVEEVIRVVNTLREQGKHEKYLEMT